MEALEGPLHAQWLDREPYNVGYLCMYLTIPAISLEHVWGQTMARVPQWPVVAGQWVLEEAPQ